MSDKIIIKIDEKEIPKLKSVLSDLRMTYPGLKIGPIIKGNIGDNIVISFKVDEKHHTILIKKLALNQFQFLTPNAETLKLIESFEKKQQNVISSGWTGIKEKNVKAASGTNLDKFIGNGDYEKVIQIIKDIKNTSTTILRAKENLNKTAGIAIEKAYNHAITNKSNAEKRLPDLIKIGSDSSLKSMHKTDVMKEAGLKAVEVCERHEYDFVSELVKISNNISMLPIVNVQAAIAFAKYMLKDETQFDEENFEYAKKNLNLRRLQINIDTVGHKLNAVEGESLKQLIKLIRSKQGT